MIKENRLKKGYTQESIARELNISLRHFQKIEKYESFPSVLIALKLAKILDVNVESLWNNIE